MPERSPTTENAVQMVMAANAMEKQFRQTFIVADVHSIMMNVLVCMDHAKLIEDWGHARKVIEGITGFSGEVLDMSDVPVDEDIVAIPGMNEMETPNE